MASGRLDSESAADEGEQQGDNTLYKLIGSRSSSIARMKLMRPSVIELATSKSAADLLAVFSLIFRFSRYYELCTCLYVMFLRCERVSSTVTLSFCSQFRVRVGVASSANSVKTCLR